MDEGDDRLARAVGAVMKDEDSMDAQLERYARGALSDAERRTLEAKAERDPALKTALELYAPLSSELKLRLAELGDDASSAPEKVIALSSRRRVWIAGAIAAAAAAVLVALIFRPVPTTLPSYALSSRAGDAILRGAAETKRGRMRADSELELILKPAQPIDPRMIEAALYVDGEKSAAVAELSGDGAVRWIGRAEQLAGSRTGTVAMTMIVGLRGHLPRIEDARTKDGPWHAETLEVVIAPR